MAINPKIKKYSFFVYEPNNDRRVSEFSEFVYKTRPTLLSPYHVFVVPANDGGFSLMYTTAGVRITLKTKQTRFTKHNDTNGSL